MHVPATPRGRLGATWALSLFLIAACSPPVRPATRLRVIARDYAFGAPTALPAGETFFQLINEGTVVHEMQLYRFKRGVTRDSALRMLASDNIPDSVVDIDGGVLIAGPGDSAVQQLVAPLHAGDVYALECVFRNAEDQPRHNVLGMYSVFEVK